MKILSAGDFHIHESHQFSRPTRDHMSTRLQEHIESHQWIAEVIRKEKPDIVDWGGDIFHTQGAVTTAVMHVAAICINTIADACQEVGAEFILSVGNHDMMSNESDLVHATNVFRYFKGVTLIDKPTVIDRVAFVPYTKSKDALAKFLMKKGKADICLSHLDMHGARFHATQVDSHGVPLNMFTDFKQVINHHYHLPQRMKIDETDIFMPGAPQDWSFREPKGETGRGICIHDTETGQTWQIENPVSPKFVVITCAEEIELLKPNDYVLAKVLFDADVPILREQLGDRKVEFEVEIERSYREIDLGIDRASLESSVETEISGFVEEIEIGGLDKKTLIDVGLQMTKNEA